MTDFDAALERLISDPAFRDQLATDPAGALAGYRLSPDELALLRSQVDTGSGDSQHGVETRTSKASLFGLLSPMGGLGGLGDAVQAGPGGGAHGVTGGYEPTAYPAGGHATLTPADPGGQGGGGALPADQPYDEPRAEASFGGARSGASFGADDGRSGASFGAEATPTPEPGRSGASFGAAEESTSRASFGGEPGGGEYLPRHSGGLGAVVSQAGAFMSDGGVEEAPRGTVYSSTAAQEYTTRVDADGDGRWDEFTVTDRADGGADLSVDRDGDGRAEFVGHDLDRDGLIDEATTDDDGDGVLDTRWVDTDGDGWLDARQQPTAYEPPRPEVHDPRTR